MALRPLEQAIIYTLAYTTHFKYPLTPSEVSERLMVRFDDHTIVVAKIPSRQAVAQALSRLLKRQILVKKDGYLTFPGFEATVGIRERREGYAAARQPELIQVVALAQQCPWIEAVFLTGSLAMANGERTADLDFLIVTQPHRLWLARLWMIWQAFRHGKRRSWQGEEKNSWCFNLWLESDQLAVFGQQASLYTAYELIQAKPLFDRSQYLAAALVGENQWARQYLPLASHWQALTDFLPFPHQRQNQLVTWLNQVAFALQLHYMKPHRTREKVTAGYAFFHPRDTQTWVYQGWAQIIRRITI